MKVLTAQSQPLELDKKDWRILKELILNIRQPISHIAKKCLLSRQSVEYRIKQMQDKKLIIGSRAVIHIRKLGYKSYHVFMEVHAPQQETEILNRALKAPFVNAILVYSGKYNLEISIMARNEEEFLNYYQQLIDKIELRDDRILVLLNTICSEVLPSQYFPLMSELSMEKEKIKQKRVGSTINSTESNRNNNYNNKSNNIDKLDLHILFALSQDALRTNLSLGKELKVSKDTIQYRLNKMESSRLIVQYRPVVNYAALGLAIKSILIKLNYTSSGNIQFEKYLQNNGSVLWATKTMGDYDYLIYVISQNLDEFHELINNIKEQFSNIIKTYEILFAYEELKYNFMADSMVENSPKSSHKNLTQNETPNRSRAAGY